MPRLLPILLLAACAGEDPPPERTCDVTWDGFAQPFLTTWCTPCHASTVPPEDRFGAPETVNFDSYEATLPWAAVIADVAGDPGDPMPPAGGVTDAERAALREWVACGAPGPTAPPADPCAGAEGVVDGPLVINADPGDAYDCVVEVTGNLVLTGAARAVTLPRLAKVGGDLASDAALDVLALPALATVGGAVRLANRLPAEPDLGALAEVGAFELVAPAGLAVLDLPRLERVTGDLRIEGAADLASIVHTSDLEDIGGSLVITDNPALRSVRDFAFLARIGGDLVIARNAQLDLVNGFWFLVEVGGDLEVQDGPALVEIDGFDDLATVGGALRLARNPLLTGVGIPKLERVGGELLVEDDDSIDVLDPLFGLREVGGDLVIRGNRLLEPADTDALIAAIGEGVAGAIVVEGNG